MRVSVWLLTEALGLVVLRKCLTTVCVVGQLLSAKHSLFTVSSIEWCSLGLLLQILLSRVVSVLSSLPVAVLVFRIVFLWNMSTRRLCSVLRCWILSCVVLCLVVMCLVRIVNVLRFIVTSVIVVVLSEVGS